MTSKHRLIYDLVLPLVFIACCGWLLSEWLAEPLIFRLDMMARNRHWLDYFQTWRNWVWENSEFLFMLPVALVWCIWMRMNLQTDYLTGRKSMDRPIFKTFRSLLLWIEGGGEVEAVRRQYEVLLAHKAERIRQLEMEMERVGRFHADVESQFGDHPLLG